MKMPKKYWMLLLAIYLIVLGVKVLIPDLKFSGDQSILALLGIATGVLVFLDR